LDCFYTKFTLNVIRDIGIIIITITFANYNDTTKCREVSIKPQMHYVYSLEDLTHHNATEWNPLRPSNIIHLYTPQR